MTEKSVFGLFTDASSVETLDNNPLAVDLVALGTMLAES
jgi:hypothetical protein